MGKKLLFLQANKMEHGALTRLSSSVESAKLANQIWTEEEQNLHINLKLTSLEVKKKRVRPFVWIVAKSLEIMSV